MFRSLLSCFSQVLGFFCCAHELCSHTVSPGPILGVFLLHLQGLVTHRVSQSSVFGDFKWGFCRPCELRSYQSVPKPSFGIFCCNSDLWSHLSDPKPSFWGSSHPQPLPAHHQGQIPAPDTISCPQTHYFHPPPKPLELGGSTWRFSCPGRFWEQGLLSTKRVEKQPRTNISFFVMILKPSV